MSFLLAAALLRALAAPVLSNGGGYVVEQAKPSPAQTPSDSSSSARSGAFRFPSVHDMMGAVYGEANRRLPGSKLYVIRSVDRGFDANGNIIWKWVFVFGDPVSGDKISIVHDGVKVLKFDLYQKNPQGGPQSSHGTLDSNGRWKIQQANLTIASTESYPECEPIDVDFVDTLDIQAGVDAVVGIIPANRGIFRLTLFHIDNGGKCRLSFTPARFRGRSLWNLDYGTGQFVIFDARTGKVLAQNFTPDGELYK